MSSPMKETREKSKRPEATQGREARLKAALKANMGKRKAQAQARAATASEQDRKA